MLALQALGRTLGPGQPALRAAATAGLARWLATTAAPGSHSLQASRDEPAPLPLPPPPPPALPARLPALPLLPLL